jgi:signal transduction histidine kinase
LLLRDSSAAPAGAAERLAFVADGATQLDRLVDALAAYALALGTNPGSFLSLGMDVLLRAALAKLAPAIAESGANVAYGALPRVAGDSDRLVQLLENLIRNSLEHRGELAANINVTASQEGAEYRFAVADNGPGVDPRDLDRIFLPFERLHGRGAGLGLASCRAIVEAHGGRIWAESGRGLTVWFTLPADAAAR